MLMGKIGEYIIDHVEEEKSGEKSIFNTRKPREWFILFLSELGHGVPRYLAKQYSGCFR